MHFLKGSEEYSVKQHRNNTAVRNKNNSYGSTQKPDTDHDPIIVQLVKLKDVIVI